MLKNNIQSCIRNLWKTKTFSAINFVGLSLGISAFLLILAIAAITISFQPVRAALTNPVKNLRTE